MMTHDLLRCPDCHDGPIRDDTCGSCGRVFDTDEGTPMLFPLSDAVTYQVRYVPLGEVWKILETAFHRPQDTGAQEVYHLDKAHAACLRNLAPGSTVLEVGCGGGQMRRWVTEMGLGYLGTDISKTRVTEDLQAHGGPDFLSDAHHLPIRDSSVDLVYSAAVTEHLAAPHRVVQEIFRVLKPGGLYLGNCSFMEPWHDESFFHCSPNGAAALLAQAGFRPRSIWPSEGYTGFVALLRMGGLGTRRLAPLGRLTQAYRDAAIFTKKKLRGAAYDDRARLADLARTAGATDWIAVKPD